MQLPAVLVRVIDPASGYFDKRSPRRRRGPIYREAAVFGPGVPGGSRQATDEEIEAMRRRASERPEPPRRELTPVQRDQVAAAVDALLQTGRAALGKGPDVARRTSSSSGTGTRSSRSVTSPGRA